MEERNASEDEFFVTSNFRELPEENLGICPLRAKLSHLLLQHVKNELPRLRADLENTLASVQSKLKSLGDARSTPAQCRAFLGEINMGCYDLCKAGLGGQYDQDFFRLVSTITSNFDNEKLPTKRLRALIQSSNNRFSDDLRTKGHKFHFLSDTDAAVKAAAVEADVNKNGDKSGFTAPISLKRKIVMKWIKAVLRRCRGTELIGNFNPSLIAELFWEQSEQWEGAAKLHVENMSKACGQFLNELLIAQAPEDMRPKLW